MSLDTVAVSPIEVPGQQSYGDAVFPLVLQCLAGGATLEQTVAWVRVHRDELLHASREHGAVLLRGFPLETARCFDAIVAALDLPNFPYEKSLSNAVRINRTERVFTANEAPPDVTIFFHHELAQTPVFPSRILFFCEQPAPWGGATSLCRSDVLFDQLSRQCPRFARDCEEKGLQYSSVMPSENDPSSGMGRSWQSTFDVTERDDAQQKMGDLGYSWEWLSDGCLRATTPVLPAVREISPGRTSFFNQLIAASQGWNDDRNDSNKSICFGDGAPLDRAGARAAAEHAEALSFDLCWQRGDVALVDNLVTMHGRRTFRGARKILASLAAAETHVAIGGRMMNQRTPNGQRPAVAESDPA